MVMDGRRESSLTIDYDSTDEESILRHAGKLTGRTLREILIESGELEFDESGNKGAFGQIVERRYFLIANNSRSEPDFAEVGLELKVTPVKKDSKGRIIAKERASIKQINYNEIPVREFNIFLEKGSHILFVFYLWSKGADMLDYRFMKVVDWRPTPEEMRMIHDDWMVIQNQVMKGGAHKLSEKLTKYLAASRKGAGHGRDKRSQPFSDIPADQRALSFKPSFMTTLYHSHPDVNERLKSDANGDMGTVFNGEWSDDVTFEEYVLEQFRPHMGKTCGEIEKDLETELNPKAKHYYYNLALAMIGIKGKKRVKEFDAANILLKTVRITVKGAMKESMSFPAFKYDEIVNQTWEGSDFYSQLDRTMLFIVYGFKTEDVKVHNRMLEFRGAFFWNVPDDDMCKIGEVWEDTRRKVDEERFDEFVKSSDERIAHVRPHGKDSNDTWAFRGMNLPKKGFWLNKSYIERVISSNLGGQNK